MSRVVSALVIAVAVAAMFLIPEVPAAKLAALSCHELLQERAGAPPAEGEEDTRPRLGDLVLDGPAARHAADGAIVLTLYGVQIAAEAAAQADITMNLEARRSLVRGLREIAQDRAAPLEILGEGGPEPGGASFYVQLIGEELLIRYLVDDDPMEPVVVVTSWTPPDRLSILPPLVAVALAVLLRRPVLALLMGVLTGSVLVLRADGMAWLSALGLGAVDVGRTYFWGQLVASERIYIIGFVVFMLAMVGVMTRSGGVKGLMDAIARRANDARKTQLATWAMGLVVFFDDYANTILVGSTMRPLTDRFRISREKLAFIVDSTAAPVAGISIFSTWIAFEVSTFSAQLPAAGLSPDDGYEIFLRTIPYSFYCILMIVFVGLIAWSGKDLGPMLTAERRARSTGALLRPGAAPMVGETATTMDPAAGVVPAAWRAVAPVATFLFGTLFVIVWQGGGFGLPARELLSVPGMTQVLYDGSGSFPLLIGALAGFGVASVAALLAGLGADVPRAAWTTLRAMWVAFAILYLAWMIGKVCEDLGTASYLTGVLGDSIDPLLLPSLLIVLAGFVAFATGSSWSTMSILLPLVVGLAYNLGLGTGLAETEPESGIQLMVMSIAAVLSGAIFGDHCSPISDTTVMSSIASASDHIDHVRTQAPYALLTMAVAIFTGYLPAAYFGLSPWVGILLGVAVLTALVLGRGKTSDPLGAA